MQIGLMWIDDVDTLLQLDDLLHLFDYQDTRRIFLTHLSNLHNDSHAQHRYTNRSDEASGPNELDPHHHHGSSEGSVWQKDKDPQAEIATPRLAFWSDVEKRLRDLEVTKVAVDGASSCPSSPTDPS